MNNNNAIKLLENIIDSIVKEVLTEKANSDKESKRGDDSVDKSQAYKRQYKAVEAYLNRPEIDATQVMAKALGFNSKDATARSHAFKKLHKEPTQDGTGNYKFEVDEIGKIFSFIS